MTPTGRPTICLNMIVRDEAHVVTDALASAAPHIDRWVIVDTGSVDDTAEVVESFFAEAGIPGELHHREWVDFAHNRSEALRLAGTSADYVWVLDADDIVEGDLDLTGLELDAYQLRFGPATIFWRTQLLSTRRPWSYRGVLHEYPACDDEDERPITSDRVMGDYMVVPRPLGARSRRGDKFDRDCAVLEAAVEADPDDARSRFYLAQSHLDAGRPDVAAEHYEIRMGMGGFEEERFVAALRRAQALERAGSDTEAVRAAYLTAFQIRPHRAEPLTELARFERVSGNHALAYLAARTAAELPFPDDDLLFVDAAAHRWRARDEAAMAAYWTGRHEESVRRGDELLWSGELPVSERERVLANRDFGVETVLRSPVAHPAAIVAALTATDPDATADVTVTLTTAGSGYVGLTRTLDSLLTSVSDLDRVARWICVHHGSDEDQIAGIRHRYPFLEVVAPDSGQLDHAASMNLVLQIVDTRWWFHVEAGWRFFSEGPTISRAIDIIGSDRSLGQVMLNRRYARTPAQAVGDDATIATSDTGVTYRVHAYVPGPHGFVPDEPDPDAPTTWPHFSLRPSLIDVERIRVVGPFGVGGDFEHDFALRFTDVGLRSAFFDTTTVTRIGRP